MTAILKISIKDRKAVCQSVFLFGETSILQFFQSGLYINKLIVSCGSACRRYHEIDVLHIGAWSYNI